ncbi:hypothetical protein H6770_03275 [Candidatus Peribacteria bacterium]|nr:hypothetical protein [Candidatus Peribacteria bacterium]
MRTLTSRYGFTLLELIVYVGITALVVVSLTNVMITVFETRERTEGVSEVQQTGRFLFDRIRASALAAATFEGTTSDRLVLNMPEGVLGPIVFSVSEGVVYTRTGEKPAEALTSSLVTVDALIFTVVHDTVLQIDLTISDAKEDSMTLHTSHSLRLL